VASAFVSYAHEDQEFVLALIERLQAQGLDVRYDQVVLQIGDSLIHRISEEIAEGDFLIAVVSPDSVDSEWCWKELALAATQGVNERRVKVLPVRFRGADMPPMLQDTYWGDADRDDLETLALRLSTAIRANLEGREAEAANEAEQAEPAEGGRPPHAEVAGDVDVAAIDEVAQREWDVVSSWENVWHGGNLIRDLHDPQRRLRWELTALPDRVRAGLPLVEQLAEAEWNSEFFANQESRAVEADLSEEMRSVRTQVAQGLPITRRWTLDTYVGEIDAHGRDATAYLWQIRRGDEIRRITVFISGTAMAVAPESLPPEIAEARENSGRNLVVDLLGLDDPPDKVMATTVGLRRLDD
jgi:hypothetical protein